MSEISKPSFSGISQAKVAEGLKQGLDSLWKKSSQTGDGPVDVIDMFSGCGGMSAGFRALNGIFPAYRLALAVDTNQDANKTYEKNLGLSPQNLDIAALASSPSRLSNLISEVRSGANSPLVMIGCAPCQGFSSHRNAAGQVDDRNSLFNSFARIAARVKPDAVIIENVPEILTDRYWPVVQSARSTLHRAGFHTLVAVHDMAEFGVPQNRYRAVIIGMRKPFAMPHGFLPRSQFRTVRQSIGWLPAVSAGEVCAADAMHYSANHRLSTIETIKAVPFDGGSRPYDAGPDCLRRAEKKQGKAVYEDVYGRLWWDRPSITITGSARNPASGRYVHPEQNRGLSVREAALLQSFPSDYIFEGSFDSRFLQIGNAVPPAFATYLAGHVLYELHRKDQPPGEIGIEQSIGPSFSRLIPALKAGHRHLDKAGRRFKSAEAGSPNTSKSGGLAA